MKIYISPFLLIPFIIIPTFLLSQPFDPSLAWYTIETEHFYIHFHSPLEETALSFSERVEVIHEYLTDRFQSSCGIKTHIVLVDSSDIANGYATIIPYNIIVICITNPPASSTLANFGDWMDEVFTHEYTHILHLNTIGGFPSLLRKVLGTYISPNALTPTWLKEGLAVYFESSIGVRGRAYSAYTDMLVRTAAITHDFPGLDMIGGGLIRWPGGKGPYLFGAGFIRYIASTYGEKSLMDLIKRIGRFPLPYFLNHHSRRIYGKSFTQLWKEWKMRAIEISHERLTEIKAYGLTETKRLIGSSYSITAFSYSPDGRYIACFLNNPHLPGRLILHELATGNSRVLYEGMLSDHLSWSPDGKSLIFSEMEEYKRYYNYSMVYIYDLRRDKLSKALDEKRLKYPAFIDNNSVLTVKIKGGENILTLCDLYEKGIERISIHDPSPVFYSSGSAFAEGRYIVMTGWDNGQWDIYLIDREKNTIQNLTDDIWVDNNPISDRDQNYIFFDSFRSGVPNIYAYSLENGEILQVTNVAKGAKYPRPSPDGRELAFLYYTGNGYEIRSVPVNPDRWARYYQIEVRGEKLKAQGSKLKAQGSKLPTPNSQLTKSKPYNPVPYMISPRFFIPSLFFTEMGYYVSVFTGNWDPLMRHTWAMSLDYRTDSRFLGGGFWYKNSSLYPDLLAEFQRDTSLVLYHKGNSSKLKVESNPGTDNNPEYYLYLQSERVEFGTRWPWKDHNLSILFFFEKRDYRKIGNADLKASLTSSNFSGLKAMWSSDTSEVYPYSVSPEKGRFSKVMGEVTSPYLGGDYTQGVITGEHREYLHIPLLLNHAAALRFAGGLSEGEGVQNTFSLGGSIEGGGITLATERRYPLRGYPPGSFTGKNFLLLSLEYRLPLIHIERGFGVHPLFIQTLHLAPFLDSGEIFEDLPSLKDHRSSLGMELRCNFVFSYAIPLTFRIGYGRSLKERDVSEIYWLFSGIF